MGVSGKTICFTGTLQMKRADASKMAIGAGASISKTVTKTTDILVAGENAGSKIADAEKKGVTVWTEEEFTDALEGGDDDEDAADEEMEDEDEEEEEEEEAPPPKKKAAAKKAAPKKKAAAVASSAVAGKTICFTGTLQMKRADASKLAEGAGASISKTVTKATDILVAGENAGSKIADAESKGVAVWTEEEFTDALEGGDEPAAPTKAKAKKVATKAPAGKKAAPAKNAKAKSGGATTRLEVPGQKFWEITPDGSDITITFGKIGSAGQTQIKSFGSDAECAKFVDKQIAAKQKKGYE
eukprot:m.84541 g.84541  ORF g.84541 m.84541 type:complete len:299 (-) comp25764_c0_seq1:148-1044(-)